MPIWEKIDDVSANIKKEPWSLYWKELKSSTPEFEQFLHDPLNVLKTEFAEVDDSFTVQSQIINHGKGLLYTAVCILAVVDPGRKVINLTFYKH